MQGALPMSISVPNVTAKARPVLLRLENSMVSLMTTTGHSMSNRTNITGHLALKEDAEAILEIERLGQPVTLLPPPARADLPAARG
jgi:hypothetical protein